MHRSDSARKITAGKKRKLAELRKGKCPNLNWVEKKKRWEELKQTGPREEQDEKKKRTVRKLPEKSGMHPGGEVGGE